MLHGELNSRIRLNGELTGGVFYGTMDYTELINKPSINSVELNGNKTLEDLGINIPTELSELTNDVGYITDADVPTSTSQLTNDSGYITTADVSAVAISGDYDDLTNKPTIPTLTSQLTNDSGFITNAQVPTSTSQLLNDSGYITSSDIPTDVSAFTNDAGYITSSDIPTDVSAFTNDAGYISNSDIMTATASGSIATFDNGGDDIPVSEFECEIVAQQGSGTPSPSTPLPITGFSQADISVSGKNLFPLTLTALKAINTSGTWSGNVYTYGNVSYTINNTDDIVTSIETSGTCNNSYAYFYLTKGLTTKSGITYSISGSPVGKASNTYRIFADSNVAFPAGNRLSDDNTDNQTRTAMGNENVDIFIQIYAGQNMNDKSFYPMLELGSDISTFEAYKGNLYTVAFGQTIYGGGLIYANGQWSIEATHGYVDLASLSWTRTTSYTNPLFFASISDKKYNSINSLCEIYENGGLITGTTALNNMLNNTFGAGNNSNVIYVRDDSCSDVPSFAIAVSGKYLVYELATPTIIPITSSTRVKTISGDNNIYSNTGDCEVKYFTNKADSLAELIKAFVV